MENSLQSLNGIDGWASKNKEKERAMFYDNSDEEAQDFDPDRAAADEALAESSSLYNLSIPNPIQPNLQHQHSHQYQYDNPQQPPQPQQHQQQEQPARATTPVSARVTSLSQAHRSTSLGRVTGRPKSPVVRRPMSPAIGRPFTPVAGGTSGNGRMNTDDEMKPDHSLSRPSDITNGTTAGMSGGSKRPASNSRGRLARTLSASNNNNNSSNNNTSNNNHNHNNHNHSLNNPSSTNGHVNNHSNANGTISGDIRGQGNNNTSSNNNNVQST